MFGPNVTTGETEYYHHRGPHFRLLLETLEAEFVEKFGLQEYDILFLTGNGTLANEAVIYSLCMPSVFVRANAEFGGRLRLAAEAHEPKIDSGSACGCYVAYETSISCRNGRPFSDTLMFCDMVSAFPYYLPKDVDIFTTVSSKQLGALPVLGIVGIRKGLDVWKAETWSILSIAAHLRFRAKHETMTTPAIPLYVDLLRVVRTFDRAQFKDKIDRRRAQVVTSVGEENVIGEGPVVTLKPNSMTERLAARAGLYRSPVGPQVFLWSGTDEQYEEIFND